MNLNKLFPRTEEFERFIFPARQRPAFWRFILGILLTFAIFIGLLFCGGMLIAKFASFSFQENYFSDYRGLTRTSLTIDLLFFAGILIALLIIVPLFHRRSFLGLIGPFSQTVKDFRLAACGFGTVYLLGLPLLLFIDTVPHEPFLSVLMFLPVVIPLLLIQTGAEELLFRGYVIQQLAARFNSPWIWLILPSALFGILHYDPDIPTLNAVTIILSITLTGILWSDLVRMTGNIGAALGWHFANNFLAMNIVGFNDTFNGFAWRLLPYGYADAPFYVFVMDPVFALITWAVLRRFLNNRS